jgi:outer membrane protein TolC
VAILLLSFVALIPGRPWAQSETPLSFSEAIELAIAQAPQLAAQRLAVGAAEASIGPARELPDPRLLLALDNVPADGPNQFSLTSEAMTMRKIGLMQDFPRGEKLRLRGEKAQAEADRDRAMLSALSADVKRAAAAAWFEVWFAHARVRLLSELVPETDLLQEVARAQLAGGKGNAADVIAARGGIVTLEDRLSEARRDVRRAQAILSRWVGAANASRPPVGAPDLGALAVAPGELLAGLDHHPELAAWGPLEAMARAESELARAAKDPDWGLEVAYSQRGPDFSNLISVAVRIDLPLWGETRQDPVIVARHKQLEKVRADRESAKRMHEAEVRRELADWESAAERIDRIQNELLPLARERTAAALAAYRGGRGELNAVLAARSNEIDTRLMLIQQQSELARAWANLNFLIDAGEHGRKDSK